MRWLRVGRYGDGGYNVRISRYQGWIEHVMSNEQQQGIAGN